MLVPIETLYATVSILTHILSHTIFQLLRSSDQIIAFDKGVPLVNALVLGNFCEYRHKSYVAKTILFASYFCQYGCIFNYFDATGPKSYRLG